MDGEKVFASMPIGQMLEIRAYVAYLRALPVEERGCEIQHIVRALSALQTCLEVGTDEELAEFLDEWLEGR